VLIKHWNAAAASEQASWLHYKWVGGIALTTIDAYRWTTDKLLVAFPDTPFDEFTDAELVHVLAPCPPKSRERWVSAFRSWFQWGVKTRRITVNPCFFLPDLKKQPKPWTDVFTVEEEAALRALPVPNGTLMALLFDTGLRKREACQLTCKRIDFANEQLIVIEGAKAGVQRITPIDQETAPFLLGRLDELLTLEGIGPDEYLWPIRPGGGSRIKHDRPITAPSFHTWWGRCLDAAGVRYLKPHSARHLFARRWHKRGLALDDIQWLMGHADPRTTQIYTPTDIDDVRQRMVEVRRDRDV
jgi:integrase